MLLELFTEEQRFRVTTKLKYITKDSGAIVGEVSLEEKGFQNHLSSSVSPWHPFCSGNVYISSCLLTFSVQCTCAYLIILLSVLGSPYFLIILSLSKYFQRGGAHSGMDQVGVRLATVDVYLSCLWHVLFILNNLLQIQITSKLILTFHLY